METKHLRVLAAGLLFAGTLGAQVVSTFDSDTENWYVEGDGDVSWSSTEGLPPGALQINDDATGDINIVVAPPKFLGDWSMASALDSLACDHKYDRFTGTLISPRPYKFEISGPGGRAQALVGLIPQAELAWAHRAVALTESEWTMVSGTWSALISNVTQLRIMGEYIDGDEVNYLDNVRLDITPVVQPVSDFQCTDFESVSFEGWTFEGTNGTVSTGEGNPGTAIRVSDVLGPSSRGIAPSAFWGDWSGMDGTGLIGYDVRIASGTNIFAGAENNIITISGPGGAAVHDTDPALVDSAIGQWSRIETVLDTAHWRVTAGTWDSLLLNVNRIDIRLEFISGAETVYFDNFCVGNPCTAAPGGLADAVGPSSVNLSWASQVNQGAIGYRVGGAPLGSSSFAFRKVAEPKTNLTVPVSLLVLGTTYEWVVQAACIVDGSIVLGPIASDSFMTPMPLAARVGAEPAALGPNPTVGPLTITADAWTELALFDASGRLIRSMPAGTGTVNMDLSALGTGMYWLRRTDTQGRTVAQPVYVERP